jgi:hypothetical protein
MVATGASARLTRQPSQQRLLGLVQVGRRHRGGLGRSLSLHRLSRDLDRSLHGLLVLHRLTDRLRVLLLGLGRCLRLATGAGEGAPVTPAR